MGALQNPPRHRESTLPEIASKSGANATSAITLLAIAAFAAQAMVRVTDSLLPQIAADLHTTVGAASIVVTVYLLAHGSVQLVIGPIGDRFGKYLCVSIAAAVSTLMVFACGLAPSLPLLVAARLGSGLATGWIIPFALAFVGDVIPYERRQLVIGRFLSGQILGQLFGQAAGGVLGDYFGWRNVFFLLAGLLATAALGLFYELWRNPITLARNAPSQPGHGFIWDYTAVLRSSWARAVIALAFIESGAMFGALNSMYSAVAARSLEIATLRAIGFGGLPVLVSIMLEALLLALLGGLLGAALAWVFFNGHSVSTLGGAFAQVVFELTVTPALIVTGVVWACIIGLLGGFFPALRAARLPVAEALRAA